MKLLQFYVDDIIKTALNEDINYIDSTTDLLIDENDRSNAYFIAKASGIIAGLDVALRVFELLDENVIIEGRKRRYYRGIQRKNSRSP